MARGRTRRCQRCGKKIRGGSYCSRHRKKRSKKKRTYRCQKCNKKLKIPARFCYWCGKRKGLW